MVEAPKIQFKYPAALRVTPFKAKARSTIDNSGWRQEGHPVRKHLAPITSDADKQTNGPQQP